MVEAKRVPEGIYDVIIIGGGPAGFTAGIYAARARMNAFLVESFSITGQVMMTETIENYPGIEKITGFELISVFKKQAESLGLAVGQGTVKSVSAAEKDGWSVWQVEDENGTREALSVIIASGAYPKKLDIPGEEEFSGKGVSYCATCDGAFFKDKEIIVVGGGDTAVEEAIFLTRFGKRVRLVHRKDRLRASRVLQERAAGNKKIELVLDSVVEEINGNDKVGGATVKNVKTGRKGRIECDGVFVCVGWSPNTGFLGDVVERDEKGCVIVDDGKKTSREGIFAAGDCCKKRFHQVVTACGDGAVASHSAQQYVDELKGVAYK